MDEKKAKSVFMSDFKIASVGEAKSTCLLRLSELNHIGSNPFNKSSFTPKCTVNPSQLLSTINGNG